MPDSTNRPSSSSLKLRSSLTGSKAGQSFTDSKGGSIISEPKAASKPRMMPFAIKSQKQIPLEAVQKDAPAKQPVGKKESGCFNEIHRIHSALWGDESIPFKLYEVQKRPAHVLDVHVIRGKGITKGWFRDIMDTPDPYLLLRIPGTPNGVKRTKTVANKKDPVWDEHFYFYLDPYCTPKLEVKLMDSSYIVDQNMGVATVDLEKIFVNEPPQSRELGFLNNSKVYIALALEDSQEAPDVRVGCAVSKEERAFLQKRRRRVMAALQRLLGPDDPSAPAGVKDTPCVAVLGSGGGFRATAAYAGAVKALHATGLLDCVTYIAGVSGSTWYLSYLYSQKLDPQQGPAALMEALRERVCGGWRHLLMPRNLCRYLTNIGRKAASGQPIAFTDLFGHLVGDTLLRELSKRPLSAQRECIQDAEVPMPIYSCVHVNRDISAQVFQEWMDFTPYDVSLEKYGASMKTEIFGNKMYCGYSIKKFPELPMSFLMGLWGSAFSILFKRLVWSRDKQGSYFAGSTAEAERRAADDIGAFRATREGYASSNNDTGSSNDSVEPLPEDEESSEEEAAEEKQQQQREERLEAMKAEADRKEREQREERAARVSKKSKRSRGSIDYKNRPIHQAAPDPVPLDNMELWIPKKKERRFRNFIQGVFQKAAPAQRGEAHQKRGDAARLLAARARHAAVGGRVGHAHGPRGPHLQPAARPRAAPHLPARAGADHQRQGHGADEGHVHAVGPAQQALVRGGRGAGAQPALPGAAAAAARRRRVHRVRLLVAARRRRVALRARAAGGAVGAHARSALPAHREAGEGVLARDPSRVLSLPRHQRPRLPDAPSVPAHQPEFPVVQIARRDSLYERRPEVRRLQDLLGPTRHLLHHQLPLQQDGVRSSGGADGVQRAGARAARGVGAARGGVEEAGAAAAGGARRDVPAGGAGGRGARGGPPQARAAPQGAGAQAQAAGDEEGRGERGGDAAAEGGQEEEDTVGQAAEARAAAPPLHQGAGQRPGRGGGDGARSRAPGARHAAAHLRLQVRAGERARRRQRGQGCKDIIRRFSFCVDNCATSISCATCGMSTIIYVAVQVSSNIEHPSRECFFSSAPDFLSRS